MSHLQRVLEVVLNYFNTVPLSYFISDTLTYMQKKYKIVLYVPIQDAEKIRIAMGDAGAGTIGKYTHCTFSIRGTARFKPEKGANPTVGTVGEFEEVEEERIETVCEEDVLQRVLDAIKANHPYEEVAVDVYPIKIFS